MLNWFTTIGGNAVTAGLAPWLEVSLTAPSGVIAELPLNGDERLFAESYEGELESEMVREVRHANAIHLQHPLRGRRRMPFPH